MSTRVKMERVSATKIPLVESAEKIPPSVIECSVNMNLSLSRRSRIFQRTQSLLIVILAIVFAILCFHLQREVRALEVKMNCVNSNLLVLMLRYEKLNKNVNRSWYRRATGEKLSGTLDSTSKYDLRTIKYRHPSSKEESASSNVVASHIVSADTAANRSLSRNATVVEAERTLEKNVRRDVEGNALDEARSIDERVEREDAERSADRERYERAIEAFERRNRDATTALPGHRDDLTDDTITSRAEPRAGRARRDDGRGPLVATFVGAMPEQHVTDTVYVGPWVKSTRNDSRYAFNRFHLVEDKTSIEVNANGLYMVSAQIYYYGKRTHYSYWILLSSEGSSRTQKVIKCATVSAVSEGEASCYTSVVLPLRKGDRLHIQQQERDRLINLREGHSYVQIMLLSDDSSRRRAS